MRVPRKRRLVCIGDASSIDGARTAFGVVHGCPELPMPAPAEALHQPKEYHHVA
jgi:hypothetical protein